MKILLLSGGSGKRLWPLSNQTRSKQFLKLLQNDKGQRESMLQRIWQQLKSSNLIHSTYICTNSSQVDIIQNQLGHTVPLIVEPEKRDTFPAIALATTYMFSVLNINLDEVICILPVDIFVDDSFFELLKKMETTILQSNASLSLVGVKPTYPSENYGYMIPDQSTQTDARVTSTYLKINHFIEKPNTEKAKELIRQNALWNGGVFAFKLGYMIQLLSEKNLPLQYKDLLEKYSTLPERSFDYEVVETADSVVAHQYDGRWHDLGTWDSLTNRMVSSIIGKGIIAGESNNTHLVNELDLPVIVNEIPNSIVVISSDGILISDKSKSYQIKHLVTSFNHRPMYEEKRWGSYRVLDYSKLGEDNEVLTKRLKIMSGKSLSYQFHWKRQEVWTIISGEGELIIDGQFRLIGPGDVIHIPKKANHAVRAFSDLEIIEVQMGEKLVEEDIVRLHVTWEEIEQNYRQSE